MDKEKAIAPLKPAYHIICCKFFSILLFYRYLLIDHVTPYMFIALDKKIAMNDSRHTIKPVSFHAKSKVTAPMPMNRNIMVSDI